MVQRFLKAKHWHLFLLTFGMMIFFQIIFVSSMISNVAAGNLSEPQEFLDPLKFLPIMIFLFSGILFGWFWSVVTGLQKTLPDALKMKLTRFKIFFFIPFIYMLVISIYMGTVFNQVISGTVDPNPVVIGSLIAFIFPFHLFSMFCMMHTLYFVAKTLKTAELQKTVAFSDFAGEFFLVWFFPIGVWIIQPKVNQLAENKISL